MPIHILKLQSKREIANHTLLLTFNKPEGFTFKPGQYGGFTLINPEHTDAGGITRRFSLLSTPDDPFIAIATRIQPSAFKKNLQELPINGEIKFAGPTGNFILPDETDKPIVFIAGGIGIAPFYSMICYNTKHLPQRKMTLFYGNQASSDAAFLDELLAIERMNPNFKFIPTMANADNSWTGETGFISDTMIKKHVPNLVDPLYYLCGSPGMVTAMQELLAEMEINEDNLQTEDFPGY